MQRFVADSALLALVASVGGSRPVMAYVDPSTGGMLFQVLATAFALLSGIVLIFSRQIRIVFARGVRFARSLFSRHSRQAERSQSDSRFGVDPEDG